MESKTSCNTWRSRMREKVPSGTGGWGRADSADRVEKRLPRTSQRRKPSFVPNQLTSTQNCSCYDCRCSRALHRAQQVHITGRAAEVTVCRLLRLRCIAAHLHVPVSLGQGDVGVWRNAGNCEHEQQLHKEREDCWLLQRTIALASARVGAVAGPAALRNSCLQADFPPS